MVMLINDGDVVAEFPEPVWSATCVSFVSSCRYCFVCVVVIVVMLMMVMWLQNFPNLFGQPLVCLLFHLVVIALSVWW